MWLALLPSSTARLEAGADRPGDLLCSLEVGTAESVVPYFAMKTTRV
jgi:hypothetical protein